ncbi:MAG: hypothetical protein J7J44_02875 [Deltaproteobacteria bacterium]|nr:hypothetical protein [Deltaproteobacteria bacterium]
MGRRLVKSKRIVGSAKGNRLIKIRNPRGLEKYGYDPDFKASTRRRALKKLVEKEGYATAIRRLNAVRVLTRNTLPKYSRIYESDMKWLQREYGRR